MPCFDCWKNDASGKNDQQTKLTHNEQTDYQGTSRKPASDPIRGQPAPRNSTKNRDKGNDYAIVDEQIILSLACNTDLQLFKITESGREQLEPLIVDTVERISESLLNAKGITEINHKEICSLVEQSRRTDASQLFLEAILYSEPGVCRIMWNRLVQMGVQFQSLAPLFTQAVDGDVEKLHRCTLGKRSAKINVPEMSDVRLLQELYADLTIEVISPERAAAEGAEVQTIGGSPNLVVQLHKLLRGCSIDIGKFTMKYFVYGAAGMGKSTLVQKIIHDWATKNKYKHFKYVFNFKCRELTATKDRTNLNALIVDAYPYFKSSVYHLWKEPRCILFIFDDLDQFDHSDDDRTREDDFSMTPDSYSTVGDIIRSLIRGELIEGCSILITSRPRNLEILGKIKMETIFQIIGFTAEQKKEYFLRYFRDAPYTTRVVPLVQQSEILSGISCNPLFCSHLASSLRLSQAEDDGLMPTSVLNCTRVFSDFITSLLRGCGHDERGCRRSWLHLGELSYKGVGRKELHFEAKEFGDLNVYLPNVTSACLTPLPAEDQRDTVYKFTHPVLLNYFAALTKSMSTEGVGLKGLLNEAFTVTDGRFNLFSRFLVGLSSRMSTYWLERELGSFQPNAICSISEWLKESVKRVDNLAGKITQGNFLNILHCLFEFGDPQLTTEALEPMRTMTFNQCSLNTFDCVVLSRTLICCGPIEELDLSSCGIKLEGIRYLEPVLCKCKVLRLKSNHLTDDCLESLISAVETNRSLTLLDLSNCDQDKQKRNEFTVEKLQALIQNCSLQRVIRWAHHEDTEQKDSMLDEASNILTIITE